MRSIVKRALPAALALAVVAPALQDTQFGIIKNNYGGNL